MAKTPAQKKNKSGKTRRTVRPGKTATSKPAKTVKKSARLAKTRSQKPKKKAHAKAHTKVHAKTARSSARIKASASVEIQGRTRSSFAAPPPPPEPAPPLLRESKSTIAALARLEKGIKALYQKDFKKARSEFKSLEQDHPGETEILARARSYLRICAREEAAQRRPAITNDQLYGLGVMEHNRGNYEGALNFFRQSLAQRPEADYIHYSIASTLAMKGDTLEAIQALRSAIELNEDNRIYAKNDSDFFSLHVHKEFTDLVGLTPALVGDSSDL